jgi:8-oxo-dGTP pyrophosphatase MutT (NUDIX family)
MNDADNKRIAVGNWDANISWELYETSVLPPAALCTAVMCVAITGEKVVLACSERGWGMLGGHVEEGETLEAALRREALEEGGFVIDRYRLFAVRKITAKVKETQRPGKDYPFPLSYMAYYWAASDQPLQDPTGDEIIESGSFTLEEISYLETPDQFVIETGWQAYHTHEGHATQ